MRKTITIICIIITLLSCILFAVNVNKNFNDSIPDYVFTYAENQSQDYPTTLGGYKFAELVEQRTNGKIKILVYAEGALGNENSVVTQLNFGGIDFARLCLSTLAETIPKLNVLQMPYLYRDAEHMWNVLDGEIGDDFINTFDGTQLKALSWYDAGARNFYSSVAPIKSIENIKGMRIRVQQSMLMIDMIKALGAIPVVTEYNEVYSELQIGTIDGAENNCPSYESSAHYEIAKYYTIDEHTRVPEVQICSKITWDKLSDKYKEIIKECAIESALYERNLWQEREKESKRIIEENNVEIIELSYKEKSKFQSAVRSVYETYCLDYIDIIEKIIETK